LGNKYCREQTAKETKSGGYLKGWSQATAPGVDNVDAKKDVLGTTAVPTAINPGPAGRLWQVKMAGTGATTYAKQAGKPYQAFCAQTKWDPADTTGKSESSTYLVDLDVNVGTGDIYKDPYGTAKFSNTNPCRDPNAFPVAENIEAHSAWTLINMDFKGGCGSLGHDSENTQHADMQDDDEWLAQNEPFLWNAMGRDFKTNNWGGWYGLRSIFTTTEKK
jgi:hypothetical protein